MDAPGRTRRAGIGRWPGSLLLQEHAGRPSRLWRMPAAGGEETQVLESLQGSSFDVTRSGVYYVGRVGGDGLCRMYFYAFATGRSTQMADASLPGGWGLSVSSDESTSIRGRANEPARTS